MHVAGVGRVLEWGEFWRLTYDACGHEQWFLRTGRHLFEPADVERVVRTYYADCQGCAWARQVRART